MPDNSALNIFIGIIVLVALFGGYFYFTDPQGTSEFLDSFKGNTINLGSSASSVKIVSDRDLVLNPEDATSRV